MPPVAHRAPSCRRTPSPMLTRIGRFGGTVAVQLAASGDAVDGAGQVVGHVEAAVRADGDARGAPPPRVVTRAKLPAGGELLDLASSVRIEEHVDEVWRHGHRAV